MQINNAKVNNANTTAACALMFLFNVFMVDHVKFLIILLVKGRV